MSGLIRSTLLGTSFLLMMFTGTSCLVAQDAPPPVYAPPEGAPAPGDQTAQGGSRWPLQLQGPAGLITIYQPQVTELTGDELKSRAAVSVVPPGQQEPVFGAMWMQSRIATDRVARTVQILDVAVTRARFPSPGGVSEQVLTDALRSYNAQQGQVVLSLDQLVSMLQVGQQEKAAVKDISTDPPKIVFVNHPAVLVQYDGQPRLMQVENSNLIRAVNTPFFVVLDPPTKTYFLKGASLWYAAPNPMGPFQPAQQVPPEVVTLATTSGYQDPQAAIQGAPASSIEIITATDPTELVWTDGPEEMATVPGTDLLYVTNTPGDVFLLIDTQQIFVLLSGRWYSAPNHNGPWTYVPSDKLPPDFARIPPDFEKANVLAQVAGTQQAKDAVADTYVPQTATIDRHNFEQPPVQYDGEPQFESVQETPAVSYCVNTPQSVLLVRGQYYCCYQGVWYLAPRATGPWGLCTVVPQEIYLLPPTCPVYSVRYCYVYQYTPDVIYCGYTPGYLGCYAYNHVVVYGTGYRYRPWVGRTYYSRQWTYGFAAHYEGYSGHWGFAVGFARGGGEAWLPQREWHGASGWFGHGGYRPVTLNETRVNVHQTNITINRTEIRNQSLNIYERRKDARPTVTARPERNVPVARTPQPKPAIRNVPARNQPPERNNVYAAPNGDVYRKTIDGWEQRDNNKWVRPSEPNRVQTPAPKGTPAVRAEPNRQPPPKVETPREPAVREKPQPQPTVREKPQPQPQPTVREKPQPQPTVRENPQPQTPAREKPQPQVPVREKPQQPAPAREAPVHTPPPELNQDYRARVAGQQRQRNYPAQEPAQNTPRQAGGRNIPSESNAPSRSGGPPPGAGGAGRQGNNQGPGFGQNPNRNR